MYKIYIYVFIFYPGSLHCNEAWKMSGSTQSNLAKETSVNLHHCIVGSVVECSPATRAARVRFPDDATFYNFFLFQATKMFLP